MSGFTTPTTGFKQMHIGDHGADVDDDVPSKDPVHISIDGKGEAVIDAHGLDRIFFIHKGNTLSLTGLTLQHGKAPGYPADSGGAILVAGYLNATSCSFKNNAGGDGGGAVIVDQASATMTSCIFSGNNDIGGAVYMNGGSTSLTSCTFAGRVQHHR
jgi:hypothetical protein